MPPWDSGTYDSGGTWDSDPSPNPKPKKKPKTMARQTYYPTRIGNQIVWLRNLKTKLPTHVAVLGLAAGDVTAFLLDVDNAIYGLDNYRGAVATFPDAAYSASRTC